MKLKAILISHLVIPSTQLICCQQGLFPASPQKVVILLPTLLQLYLFELRISEFFRSISCIDFNFLLIICLSILGVSLCTTIYLNLRTVSPETPWLVLPHPATTAVLFRMCWWPVGRQTVPLHSITIGENHP